MRFLSLCLLVFCLSSVPVFGKESSENYVLEERFTQPSGWQWGHFKDVDGHSIRYGYISPKNPKGVVVFQVGFTRIMEGYFELVRYFVNQKNFAVWHMDWYGQGASKPDQRSDVPGAESYEKQAETLSYFFTNIVKKVPNGKNLLVAHSMGGNMALRYLSLYPGTFDLAFMTSPMVDIRIFNGLPDFIVRRSRSFLYLAAKAGIALGKGDDFALFSAGPWKKDLSKSFILEDSRTSDYKRGVVPMIYQIRKPELRIGDFTYKWLYHAIESVKFVNQEDFASSITDQVVFLAGSKDDTNGPSYTEIKSFCATLPKCDYLLIDGANHDLFVESDIFRDQALDYFDKYAELY